METDISGDIPFQINEESPQSQYGKYLDDVCPYYMMYGMTWDEFWFGSLDKLGVYWQKYQFEIEKRNQELWLQGIYVGKAVSVVLDTKRQAKYPEKPYRLTELTEAEKEAEQRRMINEFREALNSRKAAWDARQKQGVDANGC